MVFTHRIATTLCIFVTFLGNAQLSHGEEDIDLLLGIYSWAQDYSGDFKISEFDIRPIDVESDLSYSDDRNQTVYAKILHQSKTFPQIKFQSSVIESDQASVVPALFTFGGPSFQFDVDAEIYSQMRFNHRDITLYYTVYDSSWHVDLGVTARKFDGRVAVLWEAANLQREVTFNDTVPLIYAATDVEFLVRGLSFQTELSWGSYQSNELQDITAVLHYRHRSNLGASLGYRHAQLDIADFGGIETDITTSGPFFAISYLFDKRIF